MSVSKHLDFEGDNPFEIFDKWYEALKALTKVDNNAMVLSTVGSDMQPHSRIVLLKSHSPEGFVFYTNYESLKGKDIGSNPKGSLLFYTNEFEKQIRIRGEIEKVPSIASDNYFQSRPHESQVGAIASMQSERLESREALVKRYEDLLQKYPTNVPRPKHWGGYILKPNHFEFWKKADHRLHDRRVFEKDGDQWTSHLLYP